MFDYDDAKTAIEAAFALARGDGSGVATKTSSLVHTELSNEPLYFFMGFV